MTSAHWVSVGGSELLKAKASWHRFRSPSPARVLPGAQSSPALAPAAGSAPHQAQLHTGEGLSMPSRPREGCREIRWSLGHLFSVTVSCDQGQEKKRARGRSGEEGRQPLRSSGSSLEKAQRLTLPVPSTQMRSRRKETHEQGRSRPFARKEEPILPALLSSPSFAYQGRGLSKVTAWPRPGG